MLYCIVQAEDGRLVSVTADLKKVADEKTLAARGYLVIERPAEEAGGAWDAKTRMFAAKEAPSPAFPDPPEPSGRAADDVAALREWLVSLKEALAKQGAV